MSRHTKKLVLLLLLVLVVPLAGIGYMTVKAGEYLKDEVLRNVALTNTFVRTQVAQALQAHRSSLGVLAQRLDEVPTAKLEAFLRTLLPPGTPIPTLGPGGSSQPGRRLFVIERAPPRPGETPTIQVLATTSPLAETNPTASPWGQAFLRSPSFTSVVAAPTWDAPTFFIVTPTRHQKRPAALVAEIPWQELKDAISLRDLSSSARFYLLDRQGNVLACLPEAQTPVTRMDVLDYERQTLRPEVGAYTNASGGRVAGAHEKIPDTPWILLNEIDARLVLGSSREIVVKNRWLNAIVILAIGFVALYTSRSITTPVATLRQAVSRVTKGHLDTRVHIDTGDELEELGEGFNHMVSHLQELYDQMEEKVERRTRDLDEANRSLAEANRVKSQFLASMSHELRTPLNAIIGFSELMADEIPGPLTEDQRQCVDDVLDSGRHLLGLINNILDLSKVEAGRMELCRKPFAARETVDALLRNLQPLAERKSLSLGAEIPETVPAVDADEGKVRQILTNLVGNAIKFTPESGRITVRARREEAGTRFEVADTGVGIPEEDQGRIFEEFRQVDDSYTREQEGTGLGLALTRKLVALHGGRIGVISRPGEGSTFWFTLPDPVAAAPTEDARAAAPADGASAAEKGAVA